MILEKIMEYLAPYWFKLFIVGLVIGAVVAHFQKLKSI